MGIYWYHVLFIKIEDGESWVSTAGCAGSSTHVDGDRVGRVNGSSNMQRLNVGMPKTGESDNILISQEISKDVPNLWRSKAAAGIASSFLVLMLAGVPRTMLSG